jgi:DNA-binding NarL/FixJ family response regulator
MNAKIKIMLVEDHPEYREILELVLGAEPDLELISQFGSAEQALRSLQDQSYPKNPDLLLLDLNLPGMSGLDAMPWFKQQIPDARIIALTQSNKEPDILRAIQQGAAGYLLKSATMDQLIQGIRTVAGGGAIIDPSLAQFILNTLQTNMPQPNPETSLSKRELEILNLLADGLGQKEIASQLGISPNTVLTHVSHIYEKLNVPNAPAAVAKAYKTGLFKPSEK